MKFTELILHLTRQNGGFLKDSEVLSRGSLLWLVLYGFRKLGWYPNKDLRLGERFIDGVESALWAQAPQLSTGIQKLAEQKFSVAYPFI